MWRVLPFLECTQCYSCGYKQNGTEGEMGPIIDTPFCNGENNWVEKWCSESVKKRFSFKPWPFLLYIYILYFIFYISFDFSKILRTAWTMLSHVARMTVVGPWKNISSSNNNICRSYWNKLVQKKINNVICIQSQSRWKQYYRGNLIANYIMT